MQIIRLDKKVLRVTGNAAAFLNGLTANTLDKPQNAFLNQHGRIIATVDQVQVAENEFLLVVASQALSALLTHLSRYAKLSHAQLEETGLYTYFDLENTHVLGAQEWAIPQRHGQIIISSTSMPATVSDSIFTAFRLKYAIALHLVDYQDAMVLNVNQEELVSFTKGCYLGQEPVAKVHNRSKPSWALRVCYQDELPAELKAKMTSQVQDPDNGRIKGFAFVPNN